MSLNEINIYTQDPKLNLLIQNSLSRSVYNLYSVDERQDPSGNNIFITNKLPAKILKHAKYILLSDRPETIDPAMLDFIYEIWPETLTPPLVKFFFERLQMQIQAELKNSTAERQYQKRLLEMAHQDYLTGLATRWYLQEYVQNNEGEENLTCIYFDLDNFKSVNDTYGHMAGDRALAATAEMMQSEFYDGLAARMGGDEFMVVLPGAKTLDEIEARVNDFIKKLLNYYQSTSTMKTLSVSAGIAQRGNDSKKSIETLIHESDTALYDAKKAGKNCCKIYRAN